MVFPSLFEEWTTNIIESGFIYLNSSRLGVICFFQKYAACWCWISTPRGSQFNIVRTTKNTYHIWDYFPMWGCRHWIIVGIWCLWTQVHATLVVLILRMVFYFRFVSHFKCLRCFWSKHEFSCFCFHHSAWGRFRLLRDSLTFLWKCWPPWIQIILRLNYVILFFTPLIFGE